MAIVNPQLIDFNFLPSHNMGLRPLFGWAFTEPLKKKWYAKTGRSSHREYRVWTQMKQRCLNPKAASYDCYGARGITVCARWINGEGGKHPFDCFLADMGKRPTEKHSIDRINNNGNYEPGNCRWATVSQQNSNRRRSNQYIANK